MRPAPVLVDRRQPLLESSYCSSRGSATRLAEVAGGTAAECAAVCCCCPCGIVNLLVLAVYKVPAGLCRKALRGKRRRRLMKTPPRKCSCGGQEMHIHTIPPPPATMESFADDTEVIDLDKEMFEKFYGGGFWRSYSQRNEM
ncbi:hypothetical protein ACS0TY_016431 [Phlomoides rotata]